MTDRPIDYPAELATLKQLVELAHRGTRSDAELITHAEGLRQIIVERDLLREELSRARAAIERYLDNPGCNPRQRALAIAKLLHVAGLDR